MKAPETNVTGSGHFVGGNMVKEQGPPKTFADFPINEKLLLDEISKNRQNGYEHIELEADESLQHPEQRTGLNKAEETLLDEVAKNAQNDYPDMG